MIRRFRHFNICQLESKGVVDLSTKCRPKRKKGPFDYRIEYRVNKSSYSWVGFNSKGRNRN
jgi:hypothetical protein